MKYRLIRATNPNDVEKIANELMAEGWIIQGGVVAYGDILMQAMVTLDAPPGPASIPEYEMEPPPKRMTKKQKFRKQMLRISLIFPEPIDKEAYGGLAQETLKRIAKSVPRAEYPQYLRK